VSGKMREHSMQGSGKAHEAGATSGKTRGIGALVSCTRLPLLLSEKAGITLALF
jgi:hypothetical protein